MTDLNRNTRTLIVSFAVALMVMVPLRFVEAGQQVVPDLEANVLGEMKTTEWVPAVVSERDGEGLEAPYDEIERRGVEACLSREEAEARTMELTDRIGLGQMSREEVDATLAEIEETENGICE